MQVRKQQLELDLLALQSLESNPQLAFATGMEDWTCLGQHKRQPEFPYLRLHNQVSVIGMLF